MSRLPYTGRGRRGIGKRLKGQCALCHRPNPGGAPQSFPAEKGVLLIAGYPICRTHALRIEAIAHDAGRPVDFPSLHS